MNATQHISPYYVKYQVTTFNIMNTQNIYNTTTYCITQTHPNTALHQHTHCFTWRGHHWTCVPDTTQNCSMEATTTGLKQTTETIANVHSALSVAPTAYHFTIRNQQNICKSHTNTLPRHRLWLRDYMPSNYHNTMSFMDAITLPCKIRKAKECPNHIL